MQKFWVKLLAVLVVFVVFLPSLAVYARQEAKQEPTVPECVGDDIPRIAIASAFGAERTVLQSGLSESSACQINGRLVESGILAGKEVVLFLTGAGMSNAAMTTTQVLERYNVTMLLFSGIAGGVNPELPTGTVAIAREWAQYQFNHAAREWEDGFRASPGGWPDSTYGNFEFWFPMAHGVTTPNTPVDEELSVFWMPVDEDLYQLAATSVAGMVLNDCAAEACLDIQPTVVMVERGVSADTFVDNAEYRTWVWTLGASLLDMETAAVSHIAVNYNVPFLAFRSLSDLAGGGEGENEIGTFFQLAADNSAQVLLAFLSSVG